MSDEIVHLYTSTALNASYLEVILKDNEIGVLIKNALRSGMSAGFGGGSPENAAQVYVQKDDFEKAKVLLDEFLKSKPAEDSENL